jgi:hypothetical protein
MRRMPYACMQRAAHVQMHVSVEHRGAARGSGRAGSMTGGCRHNGRRDPNRNKAEVPVKSAAPGKARAYTRKAKGDRWIGEQMLRT